MLRRPGVALRKVLWNQISDVTQYQVAKKVIAKFHQSIQSTCMYVCLRKESCKPNVITLISKMRPKWTNETSTEQEMPRNTGWPTTSTSRHYCPHQLSKFHTYLGQRTSISNLFYSDDSPWTGCIKEAVKENFVLAESVQKSRSPFDSVNLSNLPKSSFPPFSSSAALLPSLSCIIGQILLGGGALDQ